MGVSLLGQAHACLYVCVPVLVVNGARTCVRAFNISVVVKVAHRVTGFGCSCHSVHYVCHRERFVCLLYARLSMLCLPSVVVAFSCDSVFRDVSPGCPRHCGCSVCPRGSVIVGDVCACVYQHSCR